MATSWGRRGVLFGGAAGIVVGFRNLPALIDRIDSSFEFEPMTEPEGFRRLAGSPLDSSAAASLFAGLDGEDAPDPRSLMGPGLCDTLFAPGDGVPVAAFSDYYCPYCRILDARVHALADEGLIRLRQHEVPIFGLPSQWAARGAIAARSQGQGRAYFDRLVGTSFIANPPWLQSVAEELGLDVARFMADMNTSETSAQLQQAAQLHKLFGFVGTPALVVGRTVLQGAITQTNLRQLIDLERTEATTACG